MNMFMDESNHRLSDRFNYYHHVFSSSEESHRSTSSTELFTINHKESIHLRHDLNQWIIWNESIFYLDFHLSPFMLFSSDWGLNVLFALRLLDVFFLFGVWWPGFIYEIIFESDVFLQVLVVVRFGFSHFRNRCFLFEEVCISIWDLMLYLLGCDEL